MKYMGIVVSKHMIKPRLGIMKFRLDDDIEFVPGQFCNIRVGESLMRPYSMASPEDGREVEFYIKSYPEGSVADRILALEEGDEAEITGPFGTFLLQDTDREVYMICAGSGVAPVMCMARYLKGSERERTFLHGASHPDELGYSEELRGMADEDDKFTYVPTISRPGQNEGWEGRTGRVEEHLDECTNTEAEAYVCGPPPMVEKVISGLSEKGFSDENIFTERYY